MEEDLTFRKFWIRNNVAFLARYWTTACTALDRVVHDPKSYKEFEVNGTDAGYVNAVVSGHKERLGYSGVLLAYATLEEFLNFLTKDIGSVSNTKIRPCDLKDTGMKRYRKYIHEVCLIDSNDLNVAWCFLQDFSVVRDSIIHANGNKALLSSPNRLDAVVEKYAGELSFQHTSKLVVSDPFVERCISKTLESATKINSLLSKRLE
jgi:hypothetical protein